MINKNSCDFHRGNTEWSDESVWNATYNAPEYIIAILFGPKRRLRRNRVERSPEPLARLGSREGKKKWLIDSEHRKILCDISVHIYDGNAATDRIPANEV